MDDAKAEIIEAITKHLVDQGFFDPSDDFLIEMFADSWLVYLQAMASYVAQPEVTGSAGQRKRNDMHNVATQSRDACRRILLDLRLTPSTRTSSGGTIDDELAKIWGADA